MHPKNSELTWLLGTDPVQRARASASLLVLAMYLGYAMVQQCMVSTGLIEGQASRVATLCYLCGQLGICLCIRSRLNLRLQRGRSLWGPQVLWAMGSALWAYTITGPVRGAVLTVPVAIVLFGVFAAEPERVARLAAGCFAGLAVVVLWKASTDPAYDRHVEAVHLILAGGSLAGAARLARRIARLRQGLERNQIELAQALDRIQKLATCDELTGLLNRRAMLDRLRAELAVRGRTEPLMALALIDIDHFKAVNDSHGHSVGDCVLQRFAERARSLVRGGDLLARWGGEEFLMVMPATGAVQAQFALERLRDMLQAESFDDLAPGLVVKFSAGIAECDGQADLESAIERADRAMYLAKQGGRDRALIALSHFMALAAQPREESQAAMAGLPASLAVPG